MNEETLINDVLDKLEELGANTDNDLPKYVAKMVFNNHTIDKIRNELDMFLESANKPFIDWLDAYLSSSGLPSYCKNIDVKETKPKIEVISASEIEEDILDFEEDQPQIEINESNSSTEYLSNNKRKIDKVDSNESDLQIDSEQGSKKMLNNDRKAFETTSGSGLNVIKLTDNTHLNDIGLMRRKAMQDKTQQSDEKEKTISDVNETRDEDCEMQDDYYDLREKLNSRKKKHENDDQTRESGDEIAKSDEDEKKERCKFWPFCKKESDCIFVHPTEQCKQFPSCKLSADKCLFIHPMCKFDLHCTKKDCPFLHITKKQQLLPPPQPHVMHVECKFFPNCLNANCPFIHPKLCIYGAMCKNPTCLFKHPETSLNVAKPHQLKWTKSSNSNNESMINNDENDKVIIKHEHSDEILDESNEIKTDLNESRLPDYDDEPSEIKMKA